MESHPSIPERSKPKFLKLAAISMHYVDNFSGEDASRETSYLFRHIGHLLLDSFRQEIPCTNVDAYANHHFCRITTVG
jgi:hypothetical protein